MVSFRPHQPKHSPQTFPLQPNRSFSDQHPKITKALQITGVVLTALAIIALIGCIAAVSAGAAIPLVVIGGIAATTGLLSAAVAIYSAKKDLNLHKQKQLTDTLPPDTVTEHVQYLTTDQSLGNQWNSLEALVKQLSQIDLTIRPQEKKLLQELFGSKYDTLSQTIEEIPARLSKTLSLLRSREELYRGEERHDRYINPPLSSKNRLLTQITSNMIRILPKSGGIFSIKANTLSKTSHTLYTLLKVALSLGVIAAVACLVIFLPPCLPFMIIIGLAALGLGVAAFLMARGIKYLLERSSINRKQLAKNIKEAIGTDVLTSMVHYQHQLLSNLHETLLDEAITARWNQPLFIQHADLELQLEELTKQYNTLATAFEQSLREDEILRAQLEKRAYRFPTSPKDNQEGAIESQQTDSENHSDFQEIINKGLESAKKRREASQKSSERSESESDEEGLFSIWKPTKNLALENLWQAEEACTEEQQALLLEDYMSQKTLECKAALQKISQELHEVQKSFNVQEEHALTMSYESSVTMMDLARANQETYRLLNILSELQQLAQYLLDR